MIFTLLINLGVFFIYYIISFFSYIFKPEIVGSIIGVAGVYGVTKWQTNKTIKQSKKQLDYEKQKDKYDNLPYIKLKIKNFEFQQADPISTTIEKIEALADSECMSFNAEYSIKSFSDKLVYDVSLYSHVFYKNGSDEIYTEKNYSLPILNKDMGSISIKSEDYDMFYFGNTNIFSFRIGIYALINPTLLIISYTRFNVNPDLIDDAKPDEKEYIEYYELVDRDNISVRLINPCMKKYKEPVNFTYNKSDEVAKRIFKEIYK